MNLADHLSASGDTPQLRSSFEALLRVAESPEHEAEAHFLWAQLLINDKRFTEAERQLELALDKTDDQVFRAQVLYEMAVCSRGIEDVHGAQTLLGKAENELLHTSSWIGLSTGKQIAALRAEIERGLLEQNQEPKRKRFRLFPSANRRAQNMG